MHDARKPCWRRMRSAWAVNACQAEREKEVFVAQGRCGGAGEVQQAREEGVGGARRGAQVERGPGAEGRDELAEHQRGAQHCDVRAEVLGEELRLAVAPAHARSGQSEFDSSPRQRTPSCACACACVAKRSFGCLPSAAKYVRHLQKPESSSSHGQLCCLHACSCRSSACMMHRICLTGGNRG